jgi:hypothetical protein
MMIEIYWQVVASQCWINCAQVCGFRGIAKQLQQGC